MANDMNKIILFSLVLVIYSCGGGSGDDSTPVQESSQQPPVAFDNTSGTATFRVTMNSAWSITTHPVNFPTNPHTSTWVGALHNINTKFWESGELSSPGIKQMAELGGTTVISSEINTNINLGDSNKLILGSNLITSPGSTSFNISANTSFTFLTLVTMLAPSPDWFVGISAYNLMPNGAWIEKGTITLFAYDAGTDSGDEYNSPNFITNPPDNIKQIDVSPFLVNSQVVPVGTLVIERIQ